jgi:glycosyltransferase involved in cell wall biosynthesis
MKLAIVHDWLTGMRGGEKCLEVLCRRFPDAELFTLLHVRGRTSPTIEQMQIHTSFLQHVPGVARHYRYLLPLMPWAVQRLELPADVDLVISFSHAVAKSVQPPPGVPHVCYCFTPMRYAWHLRDQYFERHSKRDGGHSPPYRLLRAPLDLARDAVLNRIRRWDRETSDRVTHFVAISRTVARRIEECYGRESTIIYPPVDTEFYTPEEARSSLRSGTCHPGEMPSRGWHVPERSEGRVYLCISALAPYKRIDLAIEACNRLGRKLVVIGDGPERGRLQRLAGPTVRLVGWQTNETIRDHLRRCRALIFPGLEDFGIVPLEAQACGTPVIAFGQGGATETVLPADEDNVGTGVFFREQTLESLRRAIQWLDEHPKLFDATLARRQAERFAAERYETELVSFLDKVMTSGKVSLTTHPI